MLQIGDQFDHFQILGHIAQGGMSDVYKAYDLMSSKEVVLKIPDRMSIGDPAQFERFQRELEVMETLRHPAIQLGLGSGRYNSTPYLVTELVVGKSMRDFVQSAAPVPPDQAVQLIRKIADGIAHCHDHQIIHRDLKPENILITDEGQPIILDFGLALTKKSYRVTYANLSSTAGTPDYMAPEQIEGQRGDQCTDLYAIGIMFFELLTGRVRSRVTIQWSSCPSTFTPSSRVWTANGRILRLSWRQWLCAVWNEIRMTATAICMRFFTISIISMTSILQSWKNPAIQRLFRCGNAFLFLNPSA